MKKIIFFLIITLFIAGCGEYNVAPDEEPTENAECTIDSDCSAAGCSGQLCMPKNEAENTVSICEFLAEYECLKFTSCSCIEGKCGWQENEQYSSCLKEKSK